MKKSIVLFVVSKENLKTLKCHTFLQKCENEDEKIFKEE